MLRRTFSLIGALLVCACASATTSPAAAAGYAAQFDAVWPRYDAMYPYFDYKRVNWDSLRAVFRPRAAAATSEQEVANVVRDMLGQLRDVHAWLVSPNGSSVATFSPTAFVNWRSDVWQKYIRVYAWQQQATNLGYGRIEGIPYVAIGAWNTTQFNAGTVDAMLEQFKDAPAMVIDVRMNGGGNSALADSVAARFFDADHVATYVRFRNGPLHSDFGPLQASHVSPRGSWQFRKPVLLLVGRGCFSSNEEFIAAMSQLSNVTIAGDTTGGGSGNPALFDLGEGWQYSVPRWIEYTAAMQVVEWNGLAPGVVVRVTAADFDGGIDPVLEYAAKWAATVQGRVADQNRRPNSRGAFSPLLSGSSAPLI
jgi:hypothetical protein